MHLVNAAAEHLDDAVWMHEAALARGLGFVLAANDALLVGPPHEPTALCLAQGVSAASGQGAAAVLREPDVLREFLAGGGIPVPASRTLRFAEGSAGLAKAAGTLGYPVTVRPVSGIRPPVAEQAAIPVQRADLLDDALAAFAVVAGVDDPETFADRAGRYMVERRVACRELHALVHADTVAAAVLARTGQGHTDAGYLPVDTLHPQVSELLREAVRAVPELDIATVCLAIDDPASAPGSQPHAITRIEMHPRLAVYEQALPGSAAQLAAELLNGQAARASFTLTPPCQEVTAELLVAGAAVPERDRPQLAGYLELRQLDCTVEETRDSDLRVSVRATPGEVASVARDLMRGSLPELRPRHVEGVPVA